MTRPIETALTPMQARVLRLADGTRSQSEIALMIGTTAGGVSSAVARMRGKGYVARFRRGNQDVPRLDAVINTLPDDARAWLLAQVPDGATLADVLRAIVVDAFEDDRG